MGADIVDVNMGCPVPKIAKHHAGCSLMREPAHAASVISAMTKAVKIPVTVKMRAGWNDEQRNAPTLARMVEDAGAAAVAVHGRTAAQSYSGSADWDLVAQIADELTIPVFGSGDCLEPGAGHEPSAVGRRGCAWSAAASCETRGFCRRPPIWPQAGRCARSRSPIGASSFLDYIELLMNERVREPEGFRHWRLLIDRRLLARRTRRWVINKVRALASWYTKGLEADVSRSIVGIAGDLNETCRSSLDSVCPIVSLLATCIFLARCGAGRIDAESPAQLVYRPISSDAIVTRFSCSP